MLGISGTPRKGGNSEILLTAALEPFIETGWSATKMKALKRICSKVGIDVKMSFALVMITMIYLCLRVVVWG